MTNNPHSERKLLVAMELSNSKWMLAFTNGQKVRRKSIEARDRGRFLSEVALAREKLGFEPDAPVLCCYEAGRDGFWISRWLLSEGLDCLVVDPASIEVSRRKRRAYSSASSISSATRTARSCMGRRATSPKSSWIRSGCALSSSTANRTTCPSTQRATPKPWSCSSCRASEP